MPKKCEENVVGTGKIILLEEVAAKNEDEELKEGIWLEPAVALLRKKTKEGWTDKHRSTARKLILVGQMKTSAKHVTKRKALKVPRRSQTGDSTGFQKVGAKSENLKERAEVAKRYCDAHPLSESQCRGQFR